MKMAKGEKDIVWMGDSLEVLSGFPKAVKIDLGSDLYRLQIGSVPLDVKSMKTVGRGVRELRLVTVTISIERCMSLRRAI
jgi:phage-related protein